MNKTERDKGGNSIPGKEQHAEGMETGEVMSS